MWELSHSELPIEAVVTSAFCDDRAYYSESGELVCMSHDGIAPEADLAPNLVPQARKCAVCLHNQWGSRITPNGKRAKACSSFGMLWLLTTDKLASLFLLRVPATSLRSFRDYEKLLQSRGYSYDNVLTRVGVEHLDTHSLLSFNHVRILEDGELNALAKRERQQQSVFAVTTGYIH
jgi:hypothetical protein